MNDEEIRLIQALGMSHAPPVAPVIPQDDVNESDLRCALSELTAMLGAGEQDGHGRESPQQDQDQLQSHEGGETNSGSEFQFQFDEATENPDEVLERFKEQVGEAKFQLLLQDTGGEGLSHVGQTSERGVQDHSQAQGLGHPNNEQNSNDAGAPEMERSIQAHSQPAAGIDSTPTPSAPFVTMSEFSENSPTRQIHDRTREDSQSMSPAPFGYDGDVDLSQMTAAQIGDLNHWLTGRSYGHGRHGGYGDGTRGRRNVDLFDDPIRVAERERVRGENRVRKKRWRESNQDRNKDNDLRCRVTKRAAKVYGSQDSPEKAAWVKQEFDRRRAKREAKEKARVSDDGRPGPGAGSSSVFPVYHPGSPQNHSSAAPDDMVQPFSLDPEETRATIETLHTLLQTLTSTPGATTQAQEPSREVDPQPEPEISHGPMEFEVSAPEAPAEEAPSNVKIPDTPQDLASQGMGDHNMAHQNIASQDFSHNIVNQSTAAQDAGQSAAAQRASIFNFEIPGKEDLIPGCATDHVCPKFRAMMASLEQTLKQNHTPEELANFRWPVPPKLMRIDIPEHGGSAAVSEPQTHEVGSHLDAVAPADGSQDSISQPRFDGAISNFSASEIDDLIPTGEDGEVDINDDALERLIAETGIPVSELLYGPAPESGAQATSEAHPNATNTQEGDGQQYSDEHGQLGDRMDTMSEVAMSLEQINALLGDLADAPEPFNSTPTSQPRPLLSTPLEQSKTSRPVLGMFDRPEYRVGSIPAAAKACFDRVSESTPHGTKRAAPDLAPPPAKRACNSSSSAYSRTGPLDPPHTNYQATDRPIGSPSFTPPHPVSPQIDPIYASSFGNSDNMNKRFIKPLPYRAGGTLGATGCSSEKTSKPKSIAQERMIKAMGFPPPMAGMKPS